MSWQKEYTRTHMHTRVMHAHTHTIQVRTHTYLREHVKDVLALKGKLVCHTRLGRGHKQAPAPTQTAICEALLDIHLRMCVHVHVCVHVCVCMCVCMCMT